MSLLLRVKAAPMTRVCRIALGRFIGRRVPHRNAVAVDREPAGGVVGWLDLVGLIRIGPADGRALSVASVATYVIRQSEDLHDADLDDNEMAFLKSFARLVERLCRDQYGREIKAVQS
jgi:hypothetical protein